MLPHRLTLWRSTLSRRIERSYRFSLWPAVTVG